MGRIVTAQESMTNTDRYRAAILERDMERVIRDVVHARNGRVFSVRDSRGLAVESLPDLIIVAPWKHRVIFAELKSQDRKLTTGQWEVLDMLAECGDVDAFVVRPIPADGEIGYSEFIEYLSL